MNKTTSAPYNFVPLSRFVHFPEWASQVSHDKPFKDGVSGILSCTLTTESPLFVRDGSLLKNQSDTHFFNIHGVKAIPGSSLKGMIRNVIEVATFSKIGPRTNNHRYSIRDLNNGDYKKDFIGDIDRKEKQFRPKAEAGWLKYDKTIDKWVLTPCSYARIEQQDLIVKLGGPSEIKEKQNAPFKYKAWLAKGLSLSIAKFECKEDLYPHQNKSIYLKYSKITDLKNGSKTDGIIVFTGQPLTNDGKAGRKHMEFVFFDKKSSIPLDDNIIETFEFIHSKDGDPKNPNDDWAYWKPEAEKGNDIPIFYLTERTAVKSIGLAFMYRLPYKYSIHEAIGNLSKLHFCADADMAETMFGLVEPVGSSGLKGRISFSHAIGINNIEDMSEVKCVLGTPKPTYYPNYMEQSSAAVAALNYKTFMHKEAVIRGWKRYPVRSILAAIPNDNIKQACEKPDIATSFRSIPEKSIFSFTIHFHNLKPIELGALLWAIRWGGNNNLRHRLGLAKSFGFGQVSIAINEEECGVLDILGERTSGKKLDDYQDDFTTYMKSLPHLADWEATMQIVQLLSMANPIALSEEDQKNKLRHMRLENPPEFKDAKGNKKKEIPGLCLTAHAEYHGVSDSERFKSIATDKCPHKFHMQAQENMLAGHPDKLQSLEDRFAKVLVRNNKEAYFNFFKTLVETDMAECNKIDMSRAQSVLNIGVVGELESLEISSVMKQMIAQKMLQYVKKPADKFEDKVKRYKRLQQLAGLS